MIKYIFIGWMVALVACESVIDLEPLDQISDAQVWESEPLADAYLADCYAGVEFRKYGNTGFMPTAGLSGEMAVYASGHATSKAPMEPLNTDNVPKGYDYWDYKLIRKLNIFIEEAAQSESFSVEFVNQKVSEARWLRAYVYFEMVKRYGGVPLLTVAQDINASEEELFVKRDKEQDIYDFIDRELDEIFLLLPESYVTEKGRCTKWAARALQSRAMLYAASIANFGSVELDGIVGIPASDAQKYYQKAYDVSKELIEESGHSLYTKYLPGDPVKNHHQLFVEEMEMNLEAIFTHRNDFASDNGNSLSWYMVHNDFAYGWGSYFRPTLDFVEKFEFIDGTSGAIGRENYTTGEWDMADLFDNRDPRFKAAILYNGAEFAWKANNYDSNKAYFHEKSMVDDKSVTSGVLADGVPAKATDRAFKPKPTNLRHGFLMRKFLDESSGKQLQQGESSEDFHIFRLGETYLNMAEAAYYLNLKDEALDLINEIRQRAGMPDKLVIDEEVIYNERAVELAFEEHRYWDLRRWRIAEEELNGKQMAGLKFDYYNYDTKKFKLSIGKAFTGTHTFLLQHYYVPITSERIGDNYNLVENPLY